MTEKRETRNDGEGKPETAEDSRIYRVIFVDDEEFVRDSITRQVPWKDYGIEIVESAANAAQALDYLGKHEADLMLTDIVMPVMDGLELIRRARAMKPSMEIIVMSGYADFSYCQRALRMGCRDYLLKPIDQNALLHAISECREHRFGTARENSPAADEKLAPEAAGSLEAGLTAPARAVEYSQTVKKLLKIIDDEFANPDLSLKWISANKMYLNEDYLGKVFSREVKQKFTTYLLNYRIRFAMKLLARSSDLLITDIAEKSGFGENSQYFASMFKKTTKFTPSEYRKMITGK
ncbi:MAG: response regulator transcription factor [Lachnospiraceae bacterium]|jgi:two-component system response regulator YesN